MGENARPLCVRLGEIFITDIERPIISAAVNASDRVGHCGKCQSVFTLSRLSGRRVLLLPTPLQSQAPHRRPIHPTPHTHRLRCCFYCFYCDFLPPPPPPLALALCPLSSFPFFCSFHWAPFSPLRCCADFELLPLLARVHKSSRWIYI
jgi:hypothetical protein